MIRKNIFIMALLIFARMTYAQESPTSIFDEGVDITIHQEDIGEDVYQWAKNTAIKLTKALKKVKQLNLLEKRKFLQDAIQESIEEAQNQRELLLMRFALNRALALNKFFDDANSELACQYVLIPSMKEAIALYNEADLPYLNTHQERATTQEIEAPPYAAFTRENTHYLLNISNIHPSYKTQFELLRLAIVWMVNDILRSPQAKRNSMNANIILDLKKIYSKYENTPESDITYTLNNSLRAQILEAYKTLVVESNAAEIPAFMEYSKNKTSTAVPTPTPTPIPAPKQQTKNNAPSLFQRFVARYSDPGPYSPARWVIFSPHVGIGSVSMRDGAHGAKSYSPLMFFGIEAINSEDPKTDSYLLRGQWDYAGGEFIRQRTKILQFRSTVFDDFVNDVGIGYYANLIDQD